MKTDLDLTEILRKHALFLKGDPAGMRADLRNADLSDADLRNADLGDTSLKKAKLRNADLSNVDLRDADLSYADVTDALNFTLLPIQDPRGYAFTHAVNTKDGWRIRAGCRYFSIDEALAHWGDEEYPDKDRGADYVYAVKWLQAKIAGGLL